jgi:hypothetical protein
VIFALGSVTATNSSLLLSAERNLLVALVCQVKLRLSHLVFIGYEGASLSNQLTTSALAGSRRSSTAVVTLAL